MQQEILCKQKLTFCILWIAYGSTYLLRKPFGFLKEQILVEYNVPHSYLGYIDFSFLLPYSLVSLTLGGLIDKIGAHVALCVGLMGASISTLLMFFADDFHLFLILLVFSGSFQAICWPGCTTLLYSWFPNTPKPTLFGWFGTTCFFGSLMGSFLPVIIELANENYRMWKTVYVISSFSVFTITIFVMLFVSSGNAISQERMRHKGMSTLRTLLLPTVKEIALVVFFIKAVRYSFMFWLPYYLMENLGYTAIAGGVTSSSFDVGGIIGSISIGIIIEKYLNGNEIKACIYSILGSIFALVFFFVLKFDGFIGWIIDIIWLTVAGAMNCGPDTILTGSIAAKLGELHGVSSAVISVINGMGSLGTVIEGPLVAYVTHYFGLHSVIPLMVIFSSFALYFATRAHKSMIQEKNTFLLPSFT